jgi:hypothetical protein
VPAWQPWAQKSIQKKDLALQHSPLINLDRVIDHAL